jgi:diphthamide biosynthesis protein 2
MIQKKKKAVERARNDNADSIISFGGGSAIGLGKAICIRIGLYHICLPTTYAGSEMTTILGETSNGHKVMRSDPAILPQTVIYDVSYTLDLPLEVSTVSGVNAIAHAGTSKFTSVASLQLTTTVVEALYAQSTNPITSLLALEGVSHLVHALPELVQDPQNLSARTLAQYGAWLCGICLGSVGMSLHHKL